MFWTLEGPAIGMDGKRNVKISTWRCQKIMKYHELQKWYPTFSFGKIINPVEPMDFFPLLRRGTYLSQHQAFLTFIAGARHK